MNGAVVSGQKMRIQSISLSYRYSFPQSSSSVLPFFVNLASRISIFSIMLASASVSSCHSLQDMSVTAIVMTRSLLSRSSVFEQAHFARTLSVAGSRFTWRANTSCLQSSPTLKMHACTLSCSCSFSSMTYISAMQSMDICGLWISSMWILKSCISVLIW